MPSNLMSPLLWEGVPFGDKDSFDDWLGVHQLWHQALASVTGTPILTLDDLRTQLLRHAELHIGLARALAIPPPTDLVSYDLTDRDSFDGFMATHSLEHQRLRSAAGI